MMSRILWHYAAAKRNYYAKPKELERLQAKKIRRLLGFSYCKVPYYNTLLKQRRLSPEDIIDASSLPKLPILRRENVVTYNKDLHAVGSKVALSRATSGSTGKPLRISWGPEFCDTTMSLTLRRCSIIGPWLWDKTASILYAGPIDRSTDEQVGNERSSRLYKILFGSFHTQLPIFRARRFLLRPGNISELSHQIHSYKPEMIHSRPSYVRRIGNLLRSEGLSISVKKVISQGEFLSDGCRKDLEDLYSAEVFNMYGAIEFGSLGFECPSHQGIHLNSDYYVFEVIKDGEQVQPGESGELILTCLHNETMPMIRYSLGDIVVLNEETKCSCGSYLPRLSLIEGRISDGIIDSFGSNRRIPPGAIVNYLESNLGIRDFQIVQTERDKVLIRLRKQDAKLEKIREDIELYFQNLLSRSVSVKTQEWDDDDIPAKYRPVLSEIRVEV